MSVPSETVHGSEHYYAVSNWHVANDGMASVIRLNTKDGKTRFIEKDPAVDWHFVQVATTCLLSM